MIKVRIRRSMLEEGLLVEDIQNLGLPPIVVTSVLEEFAEPAVQPPPGEPEPPRLEKFAVNKSQDIVGRLYKERARFNLRRLPNLMDKLQDTIQASSEDIGGVPNEFADKFNKIEKFNITDKIPKDGRVAVITYKEMKGLQKSLVKVAKSNLEGDLQEDALEIIESEFSQSPTTLITSIFAPNALRLFSTFPAPPSIVLSLLILTIGTGASGEIRLDEPHR